MKKRIITLYLPFLNKFFIFDFWINFKKKNAFYLPEKKKKIYLTNNIVTELIFFFLYKPYFKLHRTTLVADDLVTKLRQTYVYLFVCL